jgi:DNA polymerase elongation subunit (family B)
MILDIEQTKYDNSVKISYIDKDSKRQLLDIPKREFWYWKYCDKNADREYRSWDNKGVMKFKYKDTDLVDINSIREYINVNEDLSKTLYEFNIPKILFCDIETDVLDGFPNPNIAKEKITAITLCWKEDNQIKTIILGEKEKFDYNKQKEMNEFLSDYFKNVTNLDIVLNYYHIPDEVKLLENFVKICSKFHVLTGWNFVNTYRSNWMNDSGFDWPFLLNRMKNLGVEYDNISPTRRFENVKNTGELPKHFAVVDYMYYFDAFDRSIKVKESKTLDFISNKVLGVKKLKYGNYENMNGEVLKEMYQNDYDKYVLYNAVDTILVLLLHEYRQPFSAVLGQGNDSCNNIAKADSAVNVSEGYMNKEYLKIDRVMPLIDKSKREKLHYEGAFVKKPIKGLHSINACYDFSSLYPSISRFLNLGFENYLRKDLGDFKTYDNYLSNQEKVNRNNPNEIISFTGCVFDKKVSVLKGLYDNLYKSRKDNQRRSKLCEKIAHELKEKLKNHS